MFLIRSIVCSLSICFLLAGLSGCGGGQNSMDGVSQISQGAVPEEDGDCGARRADECESASDQGLNQALRTAAQDAGIGGNLLANRTLPSIDEPLAQLGKLLFFSKGLGGDMDVACVSCHHPLLGGGDGLSLPIGVSADVPDLLGPGRRHRSGAHGFDGGPTVPRNAPTTFNIGFWDQVLFHDGRLESLTKVTGTNGADGLTRTPDVAPGMVDQSAGASLTQAQARFPVTSPEEMRGFLFEAGKSNTQVRLHLADRFAGVLNELPVNHWLAAFRQGFSQPAGTAAELITFANITKAIAAYENSQVFVDHTFQAFLGGTDEAISLPAKQGGLLFFGKAGCANCHTGDFYTDEQFHVLAMPQIGRGKGDGPSGTNDFGRFRETGIEEDRFAFRTPSLLNVAATGPWGHAGAYHSLEDVIRHHLNPREAVQNYDLNQLEHGVQSKDVFDNTSAALEQLENLQSRGLSKLSEVDLTSEEVSSIAEFLRSLTDPCVQQRECLAAWIPNEDDPDPDGLRVKAVNAQAQEL